MREDRRKTWWTIVETCTLATAHASPPNPDDRFLQAAIQQAIQEMTTHFETTKWNLESLTQVVYEVNLKSYVTFTLVGSVGPR